MYQDFMTITAFKFREGIHSIQFIISNKLTLLFNNIVTIRRVGALCPQ